MTEARPDRQSYGIKVMRKMWWGWYYNADGERVTNVPLYMASDASMAPVRIRCLRDDHDRCPNRQKAMDAIRHFYESPVKTTPQTPPLPDLINRYEKALLADGNSPRCTAYRAQVLRCTVEGVRQNGYRNRGKSRTLVLDGTHWPTLAAVNRAQFRDFLVGLEKLGRAPQTRNEYLGNWRAFFNWCIDQELIMENPFQSIRRAKGGHNAYLRRPFTKGEFRRLLDSTTGGERLFYLMLGCAGLRIDESRNLRRNHLDPVSDYPTWKLPAAIQKIKRPETLPMMHSLARELAQRWYNVADDGLMFPDAPSRPDFYMRLRKAGIAKIDDQRRHISFHSFRYFFATEMSKIFGMRKVQILLRHKKIGTTMDLYAKFHLTDMDDRWEVPDLAF